MLRVWLVILGVIFLIVGFSLYLLVISAQGKSEIARLEAEDISAEAPSILWFGLSFILFCLISAGGGSVICQFIASIILMVGAVFRLKAIFSQYPEIQRQGKKLSIIFAAVAYAAFIIATFVIKTTPQDANGYLVESEFSVTHPDEPRDALDY